MCRWCRSIDEIPVAHREALDRAAEMILLTPTDHSAPRQSPALYIGLAGFVRHTDSVLHHADGKGTVPGGTNLHGHGRISRRLRP